MSTDRRDLLERHGRAYGELGLAIAFTDGVEGDSAKVARGWKQAKPLPDPEFAAGYLAGRGARRNPVVTLAASNLIGVDIDGEDGRRRSEELVPRGWPITVTVRSGRAGVGLHLWYRAPAGAGPMKVELSGDGIEVSKDGYLVAPPAVHASGAVYAFVEGRAPWDIAIATLPTAIVDSIALTHRSLDELERRDDDTPLLPGARHRHLRRVGGAMRRAGARREAIEAALLEENRLRCDPPKAEALVRALAEDIATRYPPGART